MIGSWRPPLARREREIMDVLYHFGGGTAHEVQARLADGTTYSTVRTQLSVLTRKGHVRCMQRGRAYRYVPAVSCDVAGKKALEQVVEIYFDGSVAKAIAALRGLVSTDIR